MDDDRLQEVEVKLYTPDLAAARAALIAAGARLVKPRVFERNLRYDSADGALLAGGIVLRLRQDEAVKLTYKADASMVDGIVSRFEAEVELGDFETMAVILRRLGYQVALVYEKYRTTYELAGAEVVLDELPFGNFTEIEGDAATIERVVNILSLYTHNRVMLSYLEIFQHIRSSLNMQTCVCSFAEFDGVCLSNLNLQDIIREE